ncbi:MAG TPA: hypothetical protein ENJ27_02325 [Candidatus Moranbacteria bacterium]|nr:hypothetical protein [Candidatus Moranbacteria bacterium]
MINLSNTTDTRYVLIAEYKQGFLLAKANRNPDSKFRTFIKENPDIKFELALVDKPFYNIIKKNELIIF